MNNIIKIVIYKAQGNDWLMARAGDRRSTFYTATRKPTTFTDGRVARGFAKKCASFAREKLGWKRARWNVVPLEDFKAFR